MNNFNKKLESRLLIIYNIKEEIYQLKKIYVDNNDYLIYSIFLFKDCYILKLQESSNMPSYQSSIIFIQILVHNKIILDNPWSMNNIYMYKFKGNMLKL